jgi:hypothetical protein
VATVIGERLEAGEEMGLPVAPASVAAAGVPAIVTARPQL